MSATRDVKPVGPATADARTNPHAHQDPHHRSPGQTPLAPSAYDSLLDWACGDGVAQQVFHVVWMSLLLFALARRLLMRRRVAVHHSASPTDKLHPN